MKKQLFLCMLMVCLPIVATAETKEDRAEMRHEVRIGWGDQIFEGLIWHNPKSIVTSMSEDECFDYNEHYRYSQHWSVEYQYRLNHWFGVGALVDMSGASWQVVTRDGTGAIVSTDPHRHNFYNLVVAPTARFTYFHHPYVNLYSSLGVGLCANGGTEYSFKGNKTEFSAAFNVALIGLSANYKRWFGSFEYGGMYALQSAQSIFMVKSRMTSVSVGCRF